MTTTTTTAGVLEAATRATGSLARLTRIGGQVAAGKASRADLADALDGALSVLEDAGHPAAADARQLIAELAADRVPAADAVMAAAPIRAALRRAAAPAGSLADRLGAELERHRAEVAAGIELDPMLGEVIERARALATLANLDRIELERIAWSAPVKPLELERANLALDRALATLERHEARAVALTRGATPRADR
jgi:hypothetical protein